MKYNINSDEEKPSVAEATRKLIESKPVIKEVMRMGAVNYRGLARNFEPKVKEITGKESINLDSIVMAIRRYEKDTQLNQQISRRIEKVLTESEVTMKSGISYYTFERKKNVITALMEVYKKIEERSSDRMYILQSDAEIGAVLDRKNAEMMPEKLKRNYVKNIEENLSMVVIDSPEEVLEADGIIHHLTERIFFNGISLIDMFTTYTEFVFLVKETQSTNLYSTIKELIDNSRDISELKE